MLYPNPLLGFLGGGRWPKATVLPEMRLLSVLITTLALLPCARAGPGEDFSNNLFSDLAPILALFGEQVAMQFLSHSTSWLDCLIFACNPISIITGVTSAIRVAGSRWLKSVIGRAGEAEATAELELLSSTSSDVCELWNGAGVVRVVGSPAIVELVYRTKSNDTNDSTSLGHGDPSYSDSAEVYTLEKAKTAGLFTLKGRRPGDTSTSATEASELLEQTEAQMRSPPSIFRNTSPEPGNSLELVVVAIIGVISQAGVLVYDVLITYHPRWKKDRDGSAVEDYAFPLTCIGTLAIAFGIFICAFVIEARTEEESWQVADRGSKNESLQIVWLQRGELVGDQAFGSYAIYAPRNQRVITTSRKSLSGLAKLELWSFWGSVASIVGFVCQFVGLRNMHWTAAVAQLIATVIMTLLRVVVRRHLSTLPAIRRLPEGFELDSMAKAITECEDWQLLTTAAPNQPGGHDQDPVNEASAFATHVLRTRMRLSELMMWRTQCSKIADKVMQTIQVVMNHLFDSEADDGVSISRVASQASAFVWTVPIVVSRAVGRESGKLSLKLHRASIEGRWTPWEAERGEIEALISLWISSHFRQLGSAPNLWILGPHSIFNTAAYDWWVYRGTNSICIRDLHDVCEMNQVSDHRILNLSLKTLPASDANTNRTYHSGEELLGVITTTSLQQMCSQYLLGIFLGHVLEIIDHLGGKTSVVPGVGGSSYTLVNENIRKLSETIQHYGLATVEDSYRLVVSPLSQFNKLSDPLDDQDVLRSITIIHRNSEDSTPDQSLIAARRLIHYCTAKATLLSEKDQWKAAREAFLKLLSVSQEILGASHVFTAEVTKAMEDFATAFVHSKMSDTRDSNHSDSDFEAFPLHSAVSKGHLKRTLESLHGGTGVDTWNAESRTSLSLAIEHNQPDAARLLIFYGAEIYWATSIEQIGKEDDPRKAEVVRILLLNWGDMTLLHEAAAKGADTIVQTLLEKGMDISAKDKAGWTALHHASKFGHTTTIKLLIDNGADLTARSPEGRTALHITTISGHQATIKLLVKNGVSLNARDDQGQTALHVAAQNGLDAIVKELLDNGADTSSEDNNKRTALHLAMIHRHETAARHLILHGAVLSARDKNGFTPLHSACKETANTQVIELMVEKGADMGAKNIWGETPLQVAADSGNEAAVRLLIEKGANTRSRNDAGRSPLETAALKGHVGVVDFLIEKGLSVKNKDGFRRTALHYAALEDHGAVVSLLITKGADINAPDIDGWTPLHYAYRNRHQTTIKLLLDGGADPSIKDRKGQTASDYPAQEEKLGYWSRGLAVDE